MYKYRVHFKYVVGEETHEDFVTVEGCSENHACMMAGAYLATVRNKTQVEVLYMFAIVAELS